MAQLFETDTPIDAVAFAHVAPEQGIDAGPDGLTYAVPARLRDVRVGQRVTVPLGRGNKDVTGYVVSLSESCDLPPAKLAKVKPIKSLDAHAVSLTPDLIDLARWMSAYYCCPLGMVLVTMLPAAVKHGTGSVQRVMVRVSDRFVPSDDHDPRDTETDDASDATSVRLAARPQARTSGDREATDAQQHGENDEDTSDKLDLPKLTKLQHRVFDEAVRLSREGEPWVAMKELADAGGARTTSPVKQLVDKGLLVSETRWAMRADLARSEDDDGDDNAPPTTRLILNPEQDRAVERLADAIDRGFGVHLLHGVTGSGKTEVYLRVIEHLIARSDAADESASPGVPGAIVLVPEIALTPQTAARFKHRFTSAHGSDVAVLHSGLTASQRHEQWQRIRRGEARIVVGARSAVFAPLPCVGLIIVDEEHESSYKQDQLPRYHARDVAIKRAQMLDAPVVLGSATPSLESYFNTRRAGQPYQMHTLTTRAPGLTLPRVRIVDLNGERRKRYQMTGKAGVHLLSLALEASLQQTLKAGGQAMLLLNRRGYANYIACPDHNCGWLMHCDHCDTTMVYHKDRSLPTGGYVMCHHCGTEQLLPKQCPQCTKKVTTFGLGTQRVEEEIERKFPDATWARMDSDTMRTGHDYHATLARFRRGALDILIGTQMIAKGLDFPNVRLVGVISADTALHMPDFRAAERSFQLIAQVSGRAGRGADSGQVIVQTFCPDDPTIRLAADHDYRGFAERELTFREQVGLPPITRMARVVCRDKDLVACVEQAKLLAEALSVANDELSTGVRMRGPSPCPIARIAEFHRQQIELIAPDAGRLQKLMTALRNARLLKSDARTAVDVDPVSLL